LNSLLEAYLDGHEPISGALDALARLDGLTSRVSADRFQRTVRTAISGLTQDDAAPGRAGAFRARGINVIDVNSLRHMRFRAVCVVGLAERHFPPPPREDPLLLDVEREHLNRQHGWDLPLRARRVDPEPLQFALAVGAAEEFIQLSYPRTEHGSARPLFASGFLRAAAEAMAGRRIAPEQIDDIEADWFERLRGARVGATRLEDALDELDYDRTLAEEDKAVAVAVLARSRPAVGRGREAWIARRFTPRLTEFDGGLTPAVAEVLAGDDSVAGAISPTSLEQYARCGLQFYLARVLGLRALEEPEDVPRLHFLDRGTLMHSILEKVLGELLPDDPPREERAPEHLKLIERIAGEEFDRFQKEANTGHPQMWAIDQAVILAELAIWYEHEVQDGLRRRFDQAAFEVTYGMDLDEKSSPLSKSEPATIEVGGRKLRLKGKIDRLQWDEGGESFLVIDYKSGKQRGRKRAIFDGGLALQLPLYLHGAGLLLGRRPELGSAEYFYVGRRGEFARRVMTGATLAESAEGFEQLMTAFAEGMQTGLFPARPAGDTCRFCDFNGICPGPDEHAAQVARKESDPRLVDLLAAREVE
jgi:RecB family exonuclease